MPFESLSFGDVSKLYTDIRRLSDSVTNIHTTLTADSDPWSEPPPLLSTHTDPNNLTAISLTASLNALCTNLAAIDTHTSEQTTLRRKEENSVRSSLNKMMSSAPGVGTVWGGGETLGRTAKYALGSRRSLPSDSPTRQEEKAKILGTLTRALNSWPCIEAFGHLCKAGFNAVDKLSDSGSERYQDRAVL